MACAGLVLENIPIMLYLMAPSGLREPNLSFFFQAADGIRGTSVTGVQTCALPIWKSQSGIHHQLPRGVVGCDGPRIFQDGREASGCSGARNSGAAACFHGHLQRLVRSRSGLDRKSVV